MQKSMTTSIPPQLNLQRLEDCFDISMSMAAVPIFAESWHHRCVFGSSLATTVLPQTPELQSSGEAQLAPLGRPASQTPWRQRWVAHSESNLQLQLLSKRPLDPVQRPERHSPLEHSSSFPHGIQDWSLGTQTPSTHVSERRQCPLNAHSIGTQVVRLPSCLVSS